MGSSLGRDDRQDWIVESKKSVQRARGVRDDEREREMNYANVVSAVSYLDMVVVD